MINNKESVLLGCHHWDKAGLPAVWIGRASLLFRIECHYRDVFFAGESRKTSK